MPGSLVRLTTTSSGHFHKNPFLFFLLTELVNRPLTTHNPGPSVCCHRKKPTTSHIYSPGWVQAMATPSVVPKSLARYHLGSTEIVQTYRIRNCILTKFSGDLYALKVHNSLFFNYLYLRIWICRNSTTSCQIYLLILEMPKSTKCFFVSYFNFWVTL